MASPAVTGNVGRTPLESATLGLRRIAPESIKHWAKLILRPTYRREQREVKRLGRIPRSTCARTNLLGKPVEMVDALSFLCTYIDIFQSEVYRFACSDDSPLILDCGANIGLSVIYFKKLFPDSRVIAFEPAPSLFSALRRNCDSFGFSGVELISKAVWSCDSVLRFADAGSVAGKVAEDKNSENTIEVRACRLKDYLDRKINFLKLDVEGAETDVLVDCADALVNVANIFVEYHSFENQPQRLDELIAVLSKAGFRLHIRSTATSPHPFLARRIRLGMDLRLDIFGFRP